MLLVFHLADTIEIAIYRRDLVFHVPILHKLTFSTDRYFRVTFFDTFSVASLVAHPEHFFDTTTSETAHSLTIFGSALVDASFSTRRFSFVDIAPAGAVTPVFVGCDAVRFRTELD